jgi:uncharacterized protein (DUF433 family)
MSLDWENCPAVESIPGKVGEVWLFKDTRIPVSVLFDNLQDGLTMKEILALYEGLTEGHIVGILDFLSKSGRGTRGEDVQHAILAAEALLPGKPAPEGEEDPRWQAIMKIEDFIETEPEAIWPFALKWGSIPNEEDLSAAIGVLLIERLLQFHFDLIFPRAAQAARENPAFANTFTKSWKLGQAEEPARAEQYDKLRSEIRGREK